MRQWLQDHRGRTLAEFDAGQIWGDVGDCRAVCLTRLDPPPLRLWQESPVPGVAFDDLDVHDDWPSWHPEQELPTTEAPSRPPVEVI